MVLFVAVVQEIYSTMFIYFHTYLGEIRDEMLGFVLIHIEISGRKF